VYPRRLPSSLAGAATRIALTAGTGGAGSLAALALVHSSGTVAVAAGAAAGAVAARAAGSAGKALPGIIEAVSNLITARIRAKADAQATVLLASTRASLAQAGLDPGKTAQAAEMQRQLTANPDLPEGRRPADETLLKLQGGHRTRSSSGEPPKSPDTPVTGPRAATAAGRRVVPIRSDA
jgi:hypothetical protein